MQEHLENLLGSLRNIDPTVSEIQCCVGFDGYIDEIVRVVKERSGIGGVAFFDTIDEFSDHLKQASGRSADMQLCAQERRMGGNAPLLANSISRLGIATTCIGAMGARELHPVFRSLPANCSAMSIADPAHTYALEFDDGKLMFGDVSNLSSVDWPNIRARVGIGKLREAILRSQLIGAVNWSAVECTDEIVDGLIREALPETAIPKKYLLIDLADPSAKSESSFHGLFDFIGRASKRLDVILCLNEKEAGILAGHLPGCHPEPTGLGCIARAIFDSLPVAIVQIHAAKVAVGIGARGLECIRGVFNEKPMATTGGGDNFNGGFASGILRGFGMRESLILGNAAAAFYVTNGYSPTQEDLVAFLEKSQARGDYADERLS